MRMSDLPTLGEKPKNGTSVRRDESRINKLKKIEQLASKRYLNPPKSSYGHHRKSDKDSGLIPTVISTNDDETLDLINTSPKHDRRPPYVLHHLHKSSPRDTATVIRPPRDDEQVQVIAKSADRAVYQNSLENFQIEVGQDGVEKAMPIVDSETHKKSEIVDETQDLDDIDIDLIDSRSGTDSWDQNRKIVDQDFPHLRVANRISPGDKFYKSLQTEKTKFEKRNVLLKELQNNAQGLNQDTHKKVHHDNNKDRSLNRGNHTPKEIPQRRLDAQESLESTLTDAGAIEELLNSPSRSARRKKTNIFNLTDEPFSVPEPPEKVESEKVEHIKEEPNDQVPEITNTVKNTRPIKPSKAVESSLTSEMKSMRGIRDTSPTPVKRNKRKVEPKRAADKTLNAAKKIKLLHSDEAKNMFEESQQFDSQDIDNFDLLQSSQPTQYESTVSSPIKEPSVSCDEPQMNPLLKEVLEEEKLSSSPNAKDVQELKDVVLKRISGQIPPLELYGLDDHYHQLYRMIRNTITNLEGNSCLMMGPSGTGKKTMIKKVISDLSLKYNKQFITVKLSGSVQTDEKLAIRSIAQQIDDAISTYQESEQQDFKITDLRNSNRTLRALLKVLDQNDLNDIRAKSIDKNLSVAIVFVIDEFHKFTEYNRQSLLYNLFDLAQNSNTPIAVIGLTTKITTREMLEKRVKSRFSQKIIMFNKLLNVEDFIEQFLQNCLLLSGEISNSEYSNVYNKYMARLAKTVNGFLHKHLVVNHYTIKNLKESLSSLIIPVARLSESQPFPDLLFMLEGEDPYSNEIPRKIRSLSELELCMLLACCRIAYKTELNVVDFNSCYEEYFLSMKLLKQERISSMTNFESGTGVVIDLKIWTKPNTKKAWELLQKLGLLVENNVSATHLLNLKKVNQNQSFSAFSVVVTLEELKKTCIDRQSQIYLLTEI